jgi:site-specific DNA-cytosine methylase
MRPDDEPSLTMTGKPGHWIGNQKPGGSEDYQHRSTEAPAPSITGGSRSARWADERPATTVAGDSRIWPPGHKVNAADRARRADADERYGDRAGTHAARVTIEEAATLQSYPPEFRWDARFVNAKGREQAVTKTNTFLQIGNAVPPSLAEAVLREVLS